MLKVSYKYLNNFIDEEKYINELEECICLEENKKYRDEINQIIEDVKKIIERNKNSRYLRYSETCNLIRHNRLYNELLKVMDRRNVMDVITTKIRAVSVPDVTQEEFDRIVESAIKKEKSIEKCWRIAVDYQDKNLSFDKIIDHILSKKDAWYTIEVMNTLKNYIDINIIVNKILLINDIDFYKRLLNDISINRILNYDQLTLIRNRYEYMRDGFRYEEPSIDIKDSVIDFVKEFKKYKSKIKGDNKLHLYLDNYEKWLEVLNDEEKENKVFSKTYFLIRSIDNKIIGICNIKHNKSKLKEDLCSINYSIRPSERRKGYNKINLYLALKKCMENSIKEVSIETNNDNIASLKTIASFGGSKYKETPNKSDIMTSYYKIDVEDSLNKNTYKYDFYIK